MSDHPFSLLPSFGPSSGVLTSVMDVSVDLGPAFFLVVTL